MIYRAETVKHLSENLIRILNLNATKINNIENTENKERIADTMIVENVLKQVYREVSEVKLREPLHLNLIAQLFCNPHLGCCLSHLLSGLFLAASKRNLYIRRF